jgi:hypothetical protein
MMTRYGGAFFVLAAVAGVSGCPASNPANGGGDAAPADDAGSCVPTCTSLAASLAALRFDTPCNVASDASDADAGAVSKTCFANGSRIEQSALQAGVYEIRVFAGAGIVPAVVTTVTTSGLSTFDGASNARLLRISYADPEHVTVECDGQTVEVSAAELKRCYPSAPSVGQCVPGSCP